MRTKPRAPLHITCSRYRETPNHGERQLMRKQRRCRCVPKVRPNERLCNTYRHNEGKWLCRHFEAMALPLPDGATAITRVEHRQRSQLCISRPQYETFSLTKQCRTTTHTQVLTISMSHRLCLLGKFSDVARANRPKVIVTGGQLAAKETGAVSSDGRKAPARSTAIAEGLTAPHGIEAVPEWR